MNVQAARKVEGLFRIRFNYETGKPVAVDIVKSTGSDELDQRSIRTLYRWRFPPHARDNVTFPIFQNVTVPIKYTLPD
jgi:TonB family protein